MVTGGSADKEGGEGKAWATPEKVPPPRGSGETGALSGEAGGSGETHDEHVVELQFESDNIIPFAHYGYVVRLFPATLSACASLTYNFRS